MTKPIVVLLNSRRPGTCRSCGAAVEWVTVAGSKSAIPFDQLVLEPGFSEWALAVAHVNLAKSVSHFATCPDAAAWRRQRR